MIRQMLLTLMLMTACVIAQTDYYVDAVNGDDSNPGTFAAPIKTLAKASSDDGVGGPSGTGYVGGDKILLKRGGVFPGTFRLRRDGSKVPGSEITLGAYGVGANPVISPARYNFDFTARNPADPATFAPTTKGIELLACGNVIIEDIDISGGAYGITHSVVDVDLSAADIVAAPPADKDQAGITIRRCRVLNSDVSAIFIGFGFFSIVGATNANSNVQVVDSCYVSNFLEDGIDTWGLAPVSIIDNRIENARRNYDEPAGDPISLHGEQSGEIRRNRIKDCPNGIRNATTNLTAPLTIAENVITGCTDMGIGALGISNNPDEDLGEHLIYSNFISMASKEQEAKLGFVQQDQARPVAAISYGDHLGISGGDDHFILRAWNNTIIMQQPDVPAMLFRGHPTSASIVELRNNSITVVDGSVFIAREQAGQITFTGDHNNFFPMRTGAFLLDGALEDFSDWQAEAGEANSITEDPMLLAPVDSDEANDAAPQGASPLIGAGEVVAGVDVDVEGRPVGATRWIGAHQFTAEGAPVPAGKVQSVRSIGATAAVEEVLFDEPFDVVSIQSIQSSYEEFRLAIDGVDPNSDFAVQDASYTFSLGRETRITLRFPHSVYGFRWRHEGSRNVPILVTTGELH